MFVLNVYLNDRLVHFNIPLSDRTVLGSDQASTLRLSGPSIGSHHVSLEPRETGGKPGIVLVDGGGSSGTYVNGERTSECAVEPGDTIRFGDYRLEILKAHKNRLPTFQEDQHQKVVFEGDPFSRETALATRLQALHELCLSVSDLPVPILLECAAATLKRGLTFEHLCIMLRGSHGFHTCTTWDRSGPCEKSKIRVSSSVVEHCAETGQAIISENVQMDRRFANCDSFKEVSSAMCVPLRSGDWNPGLIYCTTRSRESRFSHEDLQFATVVATQVATALCQGRNLSRVKATAAKLSVLLDSLREGVLVCDHNFRILSSNRSAARLLGRECLHGETLQRLLAGLDHTFDPSATTRETFEVILRDPQSLTLDEEPARSLRGHVYRVDVPHEAEWRYLVCLLDDTEQRRADQIKIAFVRQLAHKLRTPLTVFIGVMSLLEQHLDGELDQEVRWLLESGESSCTEMRNLIDQFVSFLSLPSSELHDLPYHDVKSLTEEGIRVALSQYSEAGELTVDRRAVSGGLELSVDGERIAYCIAQIVNNAAKFAPGGTLTVRCARDDAGLRLYFSDDGPGIPAEELPRVLRPFHQIDREATGQVPGSGLGLWWCLEILRAHGGDLRVESPDPDTGVGARIELAFPPERVREACRASGTS